MSIFLLVYLIGAFIACVFSLTLIYRETIEEDITVFGLFFTVIICIAVSLLSWISLLIYFLAVHSDDIIIRRNKYKKQK